MNIETVLSLFSNLNVVQKQLFFEYGLQQIKYMFDVEKIVEKELPTNAVLVGLSFMGRFVAIDEENERRYSYMSHTQEWVLHQTYNQLLDFDCIEDFKLIYDVFKLNTFKEEYELNKIHILLQEYLKKEEEENVPRI